MRTTPLIGFGDADAFYASAEAVRRPWMAGLPVGVLGNQGACVIARNYPMKAFGIRVGMPVWEAKVLCPDGVYVKRDFRWYESLSRRMLAEIGESSPAVEYYSIDEFFWEGIPLHGDYRRTAETIRDRMKANVGVPMTVAFARTRTLAKLFADTAKPFGAVAVLDRDHEEELLRKLPVTEIAGIAARRARKLESYGIKTCLELARADGRVIKGLLTVVGHDLWSELNGIPVGAIRTQRTPHRMISRGGSLAGRVTDPYTLYGWLIRNVERLIEELQYHEVRTRELTVYLSCSDADSLGATVPFGTPTDRFDLLADAAKLGLRRAWRPGAPCTHLHLIASKLVRGTKWQGDLFELPDPRHDAIARVKRAINREFGRFKLRSGATLYSNAFYADPANEHDVCDIRGKFCF
jgi:DNA polymerase V